MEKLSYLDATMKSLSASLAHFDKQNLAAGEKALLAEQAAASIAPHRWNRLIASSAAQVKTLRAQYEEFALTFMNAVLSYESERCRLMATVSAITDDTTSLVKLLADHGFACQLPLNLILAVQSLVVRGAVTLQAPPADCRIVDADALLQRAHGILVSVFGKLAAELTRVNLHHRSRSISGVAEQVAKPGIAGHEIKPHPDEAIELRKLVVVPFWSADSQFAKNLALVDATSVAEETLVRVLALKKALGPHLKETENVREHSFRLIDSLFEEERKDENESLLKARNLSQLSVETAPLCVSHYELQSAYTRLVVALVEAASETARLLAEMQAESHSPVQKINAVRTAMNNCLAVDLYLRLLGREMDELGRMQPRHNPLLGGGYAALRLFYEEAAAVCRLHSSRAAG